MEDLEIHQNNGAMEPIILENKKRMQNRTILTVFAQKKLVVLENQHLFHIL